MKKVLRKIKEILRTHQWASQCSYAAFAAVGVVLSLAAAGQPKLPPVEADKAFCAGASVQAALQLPRATQSVTENSLSYSLAASCVGLDQMPEPSSQEEADVPPQATPEPSPTPSPASEVKKEAKPAAKQNTAAVKKQEKAAQTDTASAQQQTANNSNVILLAKIMWSEARGESDAGQIAVGTVVMNRVKSAQWPNTIKGVLTQKSQFAKLSKYDSRSLANAKKVYQGERNLPADVYFFKATRTGRSWSGRTFVKQIGNHYFYR